MQSSSMRDTNRDTSNILQPSTGNSKSLMETYLTKSVDSNTILLEHSCKHLPAAM